MISGNLQTRQQESTMRWGFLKSALCALGALAIGNSAFSAEGKTVSIKIDESAKKAPITVGGKPFTTFTHDPKMPKPFFSPVHAPNGKIITRPILKPKDDHPHHKGIWCAIDEVNDIKFWAEKGRIENRSVSVDPATGALKIVNEWMEKPGVPLLTETTLVTFLPAGTMAFDITLTAKKPLHFGDTKEGLFGIRLVDSLREKEGGKIVNAEGLKGSKECWGKPSKWVDYYGTVEGTTVGAALFDHPGNFRKSRYHVRDYGLFTINPFGQKSYTGGKLPANDDKLAAGKSLRLRYAVYVHNGDTTQGKVADAYQEYVKWTK